VLNIGMAYDSLEQKQFQITLAASRLHFEVLKISQ
jgi:hypothetical protein